MNHESECEEQRRLLYHVPRLVSLGSVESLVQGVASAGSDAGPGYDCAFYV
jgi:hypothetical protein